MSEYPEHEKLQAVANESQAIGDFVEWLGQRGIHLGEYLEGKWIEARLVPTHRSTVDLLADFFYIDQRKLEAEKRAMLAALRAAG